MYHYIYDINVLVTDNTRYLTHTCCRNAAVPRRHSSLHQSTLVVDVSARMNVQKLETQYNHYQLTMNECYFYTPCLS